MSAGFSGLARECTQKKPDSRGKFATAKVSQAGVRRGKKVFSGSKISGRGRAFRHKKRAACYPGRLGGWPWQANRSGKVERRPGLVPLQGNQGRARAVRKVVAHAIAVMPQASRDGRHDTLKLRAQACWACTRHELLRKASVTNAEWCWAGAASRRQARARHPVDVRKQSQNWGCASITSCMDASTCFM